jgi:hypothetical protein
MVVDRSEGNRCRQTRLLACLKGVERGGEKKEEDREKVNPKEKEGEENIENFSQHRVLTS